MFNSKIQKFIQMKKIYQYISVVALALTQGFSSCERLPDVTPNSELAPDNVLTSEKGRTTLLFSAYAHQQTQQNSRCVINNSEMCTDLALNSGGAENGQLIHIMNFTWDTGALSFQGDVVAPNYRCIRDADDVIANVDQLNANEETKKKIRAEAPVVRAQAYTMLYNWFGLVPLRPSTSQSVDLARAPDDEIKIFVETVIMESFPDLPNPGQQETFGRLNTG